MVVVAPMDVRLDEDNVVQPDLIYISEQNFGIIRGKDLDLDQLFLPLKRFDAEK
jgi:hypothetical protein